MTVIPGLLLIGFIIGFICALCVMRWAVGGDLFTRLKLRVEVGQSYDPDYGRPMQHMISARIKQSNGRVLHFERVDMREEGWEERLAEAIASMKQKRAYLLAASKIAREL